MNYIACHQQAHNPKVAGSNPAPATNAFIEFRVISKKLRVQIGTTCVGGATQKPLHVLSRSIATGSRPLDVSEAPRPAEKLRAVFQRLSARSVRTRRPALYNFTSAPCNGTLQRSPWPPRRPRARGSGYGETAQVGRCFLRWAAVGGAIFAAESRLSRYPACRRSSSSASRYSSNRTGIPDPRRRPNHSRRFRGPDLPARTPPRRRRRCS